MTKWSYPIQRIENRILDIKEYNCETDFFLFNYCIEQAVIINLPLTLEEIDILHKMAHKIKDEIREMDKK